MKLFLNEKHLRSQSNRILSILLMILLKLTKDGKNITNKPKLRAHVDLSESNAFMERSQERIKKIGCKGKSRDSSTKSWGENNKLVIGKHKFKADNNQEFDTNDALSLTNRQFNLTAVLNQERSCDSTFDNNSSIKYKSLCKKIDDSFYVSKDYRQFCLNNKIKASDYQSPNSSNLDEFFIQASKCVSNTGSYFSNTFDRESIIKAVCNLNDSSPSRRRSFIKNKENQISRNTKTCDTSYTDLYKYKKNHSNDIKFNEKLKRNGSKKAIISKE